MKKLTCDLCDYSAEGETFEAWMEALKPHYAEAHKDFMATMEQKTAEEQKSEMEKLMKENKMRFENI